MAKHPRKPLRSVFPKANVEAVDLVDKMLNYDPQARPQAVEALAHPWLKEQHDPAQEPVADKVIDFEFDRTEGLTTEDVRALMVSECSKMRLGGAETERDFDPEHVTLPPVKGAGARESDPMPAANPALWKDPEEGPPEMPPATSPTSPSKSTSPIQIAEGDLHKISHYVIPSEEAESSVDAKGCPEEKVDDLVDEKEKEPSKSCVPAGCSMA